MSADAAEELARRIQRRGASLAADAAQHATEDGRKTLMSVDFGIPEGELSDRGSLALPVAPVDRIARLDIDHTYRVAMDARLALAEILEEYATDAAEGAVLLAEHADRRTVQAEDIETYYQLVE